MILKATGNRPRADFAWVVVVVFTLGLTGCHPPEKSTVPASESKPAAQVWRNSLGMEFLPIPETNVLMSVWVTRVKDFAQFADDTGYDASENFYYYDKRSWRRDERYWRDPGFPQTDEHPVVGISWRDAAIFCAWLTDREHASGMLSKQKVYRLPTDNEWTLASETDPPDFSYDRFANYHPNLEIDSFEITSPVGFFPANRHGFFDMAGNVWEYCLDLKPYSDDLRVIRGGSWQNWHPRFVGSQARGFGGMDVRITIYGFRVVVADRDGRYEDMIRDARSVQ